MSKQYTSTGTIAKTKIVSKTAMAVAIVFLGIAALAAAGAGMRSNDRGRFVKSRNNFVQRSQIIKSDIKLADLIITDISVKSKKTSNGNWEIIVYYGNNGNDDVSKEFKVTLWGEDMDQNLYKICEKMVLKNFNSFKVNDSGIMTCNVGLPVETQAYKAKIDSSDVVAESNKYNNIFWKGTSSSNLPDLTIKNFFKKKNDNGSGATVSFEVVNQGRVDSVNTEIVLQHKVARGGYQNLFSSHTGVLSVGESKTFSYNLGSEKSPDLKILVDVNNMVNEANESNNVLNKFFNELVADLHIVGSSFEPFEEGKILGSGVLYFTFRIKNSGDVGVSNVNVVVSDQKGWGDSIIIPNIAAGEEKNANFSLTPVELHSTYNPHFFTVLVDPLNQITELDEKNNKFSMFVNIPGYLKNAIIQFKMPDTDFSGKIENKNVYELMNAQSGVTPHQDLFGDDKPVHSLYYLDTWWKNQRYQITNINRLVFKSDIFGLFDLNEVPHRKNGESCSVLESFFEQASKDAGIDLDDYETVMYIYYDDLFERDGKIGAFKSCAIQNEASFNNIETVYLGSNPDAELVEVPLHESGHIVGLVDTYVGDGQVCKDPEGLPEPNKIPKFPQTKACLMCISKVMSPNDPNPGIWSENVSTADEWTVCPLDLVYWP
ncbi:hypothetical protein KJ785_03565 [Patescibacteria group bacterium]|nr:hypothetical protein [Patescibacteria group bacterium]